MRHDRLTSIILFTTIACSGMFCDNSKGNQDQPLEKMTATISPEGGSIESETGSWDLVFPPGALAQSTDITVTTWPGSKLSIPEGYLTMFPAFEFNPHGINFTGGVTLRIHYDQEDMPEDGIEERLIGFYYLNDDGSLEKAESTLNTSENLMEVTLPHFSFGVGLRMGIALVNMGIISNERVVQLIADRVVEELASMTPEEREAFYEENSALLEPFSEKLDEILPENPITEIMVPVIVFYQDADGDGFGNPDVSVNAETAPPDYVADNNDCDDTNFTINPAGNEIQDGIDNDCNGIIDDVVYYQDVDHDGYGNPAVSITATTPPFRYATNNNDCDDTHAAINPGANEIQDGIDNNCNGIIDDVRYYLDADGDATGNPNESIILTTPPTNNVYILDSTDCDDTNCDVFPGHPEILDGLDNDCNGIIDDVVYYQDVDHDNYGNPSVSITATTAPSGYVTNNNDCDDTHAGINPGANEVQDGIDNDCNGIIDEVVYYQDADNDTYGDPNKSKIFTTPPAGFVYILDNTDCDDTNCDVFPGHTEILDGLDNDCNGIIDDIN